MPGRKTRTSRPLMLLAFLLCAILGGVFTQSSGNPSPLSSSASEMFVAEKPGEPAVHSDSAGSDTDQPTNDSRKKDPAPTNTPTPAKAQKKSPKASFKVSPEAKKGVWTPSGSDWMFLVDGVPYTGWFNDTDGKRYFFNKDGIMQRGWLEEGGKRYYLNLDGIMQTGTLTIDNESYTLKKDGSLKGYQGPTPTPEEKTSAKKSKKTKEKKEKKYAALTFDDGPGSFTGELLDCLEENNAKATFFMVGTQISSFPNEVKRMAELGCELGNHTEHHLDLTKLSPEEIHSELSGVDAKLTELTGQGASVIRPPYGSINDNVKASVGTPMILWSIDTLDWKTLDVQKTVDTVMEEVKDGSIILMHDIYSETVAAAKILIPKLMEEGYELVTIHELAQIKGIDLKNGIPYGEMN